MDRWVIDCQCKQSVDEIMSTNGFEQWNGWWVIGDEDHALTTIFGTLTELKESGICFERLILFRMTDWNDMLTAVN